MIAPIRKLICAWCSRVLREGIEPASHGICISCALQFRIEAGLPLEQRLDDAARMAPTVGG